MTPETPGSTALTFLFTDVEDSTRLWEEDAELASAAMARHDEIIEEAVSAYNGTVVRPRGEGDSRFVVFDDPVEAVNASVEIQERLCQEAWPANLGIRVRVAVHSGAGDFRDGDYYGPEVNRCARIRALAHGGQTLLSSVTESQVKDRIRPDVGVKSLGVIQLRGLKEPEHIFQLAIPGLRSDFPPLKVEESPYEPPPIDQRIQFTDAPDGTSLAFAVAGEGPPLVKAANWLNHLEFDWHSPIWRHWMHAFTQKHRLIRYDERGSGLSDWRPEALTFETWVDDLETVVDAAGLERFPLVGISQGGAVSVEYARRHPEKVSKLILYGAYVQGWRLRAEHVDEIVEREALITLTKTGWGKENPAYRQVFTSRFMPEASVEQMNWFNELQRNSTSPENAIRLQEITSSIDVTEAASAVTVPTLVLHARMDGSIPFEQGRRLAALIPGARFVPLESRNHILLETEPAWAHFLEEFYAFLN